MRQLITACLFGCILVIGTVKYTTKHHLWAQEHTRRSAPIQVQIQPQLPSPVTQPVQPQPIPAPTQPQPQPQLETIVVPDIRHLQGLYNDPKSHAQRDLGDPHECTHQVNSQVRNQLMQQRGGGWNGVYVLRGKAFPVQEPPFKLQQVAAAIPPEKRGKRTFSLYMQRQLRDWNDHPCYILDEWTAYLNGVECDLAAGKHDQASFWIQCAQEFDGYAQVLHNMANRQGYDAKQLKGIVDYLHNRTTSLAETRVDVVEVRKLLFGRSTAEIKSFRLDELYDYIEENTIKCCVTRSSLTPWRCIWPLPRWWWPL